MSTLQVFGSDTIFPFTGSALVLVVAVVLVVGWLLLVGTIALRRDDVAMSNRVAQLYGYTVCLVAIVVGLITISSIINAAMDRANPLESQSLRAPYGESLTSFEAYQATYAQQQMMFNRGAGAQPDSASQATLRRRYDALVADRVAVVRLRTAKTLVTSSLLLVLAAALFAFHWRWLRRLPNPAGAAV